MNDRREEPAMTASPTRILVVANRTASTPALLDEVTRRAREGARFVLLVPTEKTAHGGDDWSIADATGMLQRASGAPVESLDGGADTFDAVHRALQAGAFDEIILSTPQEHLSRWIHHDLRHRLEHLEVPVCVIPPEPDAPLPEHLIESMPDRWAHPRPVAPEIP
jgi:hypothetical protein